MGLATSVPRPLARYLVALLAVDIAACGIYDISLKIAMMASGALTCLSVPLFSLFSGYSEERIAKIKRIVHRTTFLLAGFSVLGVATYVLWGNDMIAFAFGDGDSRLFNTSLILLAGLALTAVFEPSVRALWALGHTGKCMVVRFWTLFMFVVMVFAFSFLREPLYRIAFSFALGEACGGVLMFLLFHRLYGFGAMSLRISEGTTSA